MFSSYLKGREQKVEINNNISDKTEINYSVPQGTVLGPILFIIYINGLLNQQLQGKIICFADDTVLLLKNHCLDGLYKMAGESLTIVKNWLDNNSLEINMDKTKYIHFGIKKTFTFTKS